MTRIRDPIEAFWILLSKRYRAIAQLLYAQSHLPLDGDYEDLAQDTLIKTKAFVDRRRTDDGEAFAINAEFLDECVRHGRVCMKNAFRDRVRKTRRRVARHQPFHDGDNISKIVLSVADRRNTADAKAVALSWVRDMRSRSKRAVFQRMLSVLAEMVEDGFPDISLQDVADRANATHNDVYKFKLLVQDTRNELAAKGQSL